LSFSTAGWWRGFLRAQPLAVGVFGYAVAFGLLASDAGLSVLEAVLMSATVYSGSAQVATVGGLAAGAGILASVVTVLMLNARYLLYGASLRPWLSQSTPGQAYASLYFLGDGNWLLSMNARNTGEQDAGFVFGSGIAMFLPWVGGTLLGSVAGNWIGRPELLALDFLLVAFCAAMAVDLFKSRGDLWIVAVAAAVALGVDRFAPSGWTIVATGVAGIVAGYLRHADRA
jgi:4-azaleucine resistance transporter AzlC